MVLIYIDYIKILMIYYTHKDTNDIYDPNRFDINGKHKDTNNEYDKDGFNIKGIHRDTGTFLNKKMISERIYQKILIG